MQLEFLLEQIACAIRERQEPSHLVRPDLKKGTASRGAGPAAAARTGSRPEGFPRAGEMRPTGRRNAGCKVDGHERAPLGDFDGAKCAKADQTDEGRSEIEIRVGRIGRLGGRTQRRAGKERPRRQDRAAAGYAPGHASAGAPPAPPPTPVTHRLHRFALMSGPDRACGCSERISRPRDAAQASHRPGSRRHRGKGCHLKRRAICGVIGLAPGDLKRATSAR